MSVAWECGKIRLGMGPLGFMPEDRETDGRMSLAPKGFYDAVIRARKTHPPPPLEPESDMEFERR